MQSTETSALAAELLALERKRQRGALSVEEAARHEELELQLFVHYSPAPGAEQRAHPRIPTELEARLSLGQTAILCSASEFSMGGLSLRGHLWIDAGVELMLDNLRAGRRDYPMSIRSRIVWKSAENGEQPCAGLEFICPDGTTCRQLQVVFDWLLICYLEQLVGAS